MLIAILSLIDIFIGGLLLFKSFPFFSVVLVYFGYFSLSKGLWSIASSYASRYYFDWMGWLDLLAGIFLLLIYYNIIFDFVSVLAIFVILKGIYSLVLSIP